MKLLDTFAGIGGFSYAAEKLVGGFETTQFIEINPFCQKVLNKHWSHVPIHDDITTFTAKSGEFDIITGGFPCQDISVAGLQKGITKETRSGLFYELIRIIRMVRPRYVVLENVAAILNRGLDIVLRELYEAGYDAEWAVISASSLGACHQRSRWWLVAYPNSKQSSRTKSEIQTRRNSTSSSNRPRNVTNTKSKSSNGSELRSALNKKSSVSKSGNCNIQSSHPDSKRLQGLRGKYELQESCKERTFTWRNSGITLNPNWKGYKSKPTLCRGDDGLSNRVDRLKALGNSVVPQVAAIPLQRVKDLYATAS
tara:strand:+ start:52 stop:984 length:933 start_codon:yes stop_codon:yes gene_type:complete